MSTQKETIEFILDALGDRKTFTARAMFGEYALYAKGKVVGLVCSNLLYVKILPASEVLETVCEKGEPYPGAKLYYIVDEGQLSGIEKLPALLLDISNSLPAKKMERKKPKPSISVKLS